MITSTSTNITWVTLASLTTASQTMVSLVIMMLMRVNESQLCFGHKNVTFEILLNVIDQLNYNWAKGKIKTKEE